MDSVASIGVPAITEKKAQLLPVSLVLSAASAVFFLIGAIGGSTSAGVIQSVPWQQDKTAKFYYGLAAFYSDATEEVVTFKDACIGTIAESDGCKFCYDNQSSASIGLSAASLIVSAGALVAILLRFNGDSVNLKFASVVSTILPVIFTIANLASYSKCVSALKDIFQDIEYGPGWILTLVGLLAVFLSFVINLLIQADGGATSVLPVLPK